MSNEKHHHFGHHHEEEEKRSEKANYPAGGGDGYGQNLDYSVAGNSYGGAGGYSDNTGYGRGGDYSANITEISVDYQKEEKEHKRKEHLGEAGALAAGAFALYEKHEAKKNPEHGHRHKVEEEIAAAVSVGAGGYTFHEHHEKKEAKENEEAAEGKKKHHFF